MTRVTFSGIFTRRPKSSVIWRVGLGGKLLSCADLQAKENNKQKMTNNNLNCLKMKNPAFLT
jgi:hypothetical protein